MALGSGDYNGPGRAGPGLSRAGREMATTVHLPSTPGAPSAAVESRGQARPAAALRPEDSNEQIWKNNAAALEVAEKPISHECRAAGVALTTVPQDSVRYADPLG